MAVFTIPQVFVLEDTGTHTMILDITRYLNCRSDSINILRVCSFPACDEFRLMFELGDTIKLQFDFEPVTVLVRDLNGVDLVLAVTIVGNQITFDTSLLPGNVPCFLFDVDGQCTWIYELDICGLSVLISSDYSDTDIIGNDYTGDFVNALRYPGEIDITGFTRETELDEEGRLLKTKEFETARLRFEAMDLTFARLINNVLSGKDVLVNSELWEVLDLPQKNNDIKTDFYLDIQLRRQIADITFPCD